MVANMLEDRGPMRRRVTRYCVRCAGSLSVRIPGGDCRERLVCADCDHVHYENPRILVSCLVISGPAVLLCRRALNPAYGRWAPPGGYLENGETLEEAAARETWEEAGVALDPRQLVCCGMRTLTELAQVHIAFQTSIANRDCMVGPEVLEAGFFFAHDVPWEEITYPEIAADLRGLFDGLGAKAPLAPVVREGISRLAN